MTVPHSSTCTCGPCFALAAMPRTYDEFEAIYEAISSLVENTECDLADDEMDEDTLKKLNAARMVRDRMTERLCALAERPMAVAA